MADWLSLLLPSDSIQCSYCFSLNTITVYGYHCVVGSRALIANEATETEPSAAVGEWMSSVLKPHTSDSSTACLILDLKLEEFIKRINVELISQDVNDTIQKTSLFDYVVKMDDLFTHTKERFIKFEFHLNYVVQYQVNA